MQLEVLKYLHDILESTEKLFSYTKPILHVNDPEQNEMLKDAIERRLSIIGEALYKANKIDKDLPIAHKNRIIALRHIIVHDYDAVNPAGIFIILKEHLPTLQKEVKQILDQFPPEENIKLDI